MKLNLKTNNYVLWILLALLLKGLYFWSHIYLNYSLNKPLLGHFTYDSNDYYSSMNHFYLNGVYSPDERMPGVGIIYLLFRPFFEHNTVLNLILVLQWIVTSIAVYVLSLLIERLCKKDTIFYYVFFLSTLTHYLFVWDTFYLSESFCLSSFIFALWYLYRYYETGGNKHLFISGAFLAWCSFMRPVFFIFYAIIILFILLQLLREKENFRNVFMKVILFTGVFILIDSMWLWRNLKVNDRVIPLNDIAWYSETNDSTFIPALYLFLESWGGDLEGEMHWFEVENVNYEGRDTTLPAHMYTSAFNRDSLVTLKQKIKQYKAAPTKELNRAIDLTFQRYARSVKEEKPMLNYFGSGFIYLKKLLFTDYLNFEKMNNMPLARRFVSYMVSLLFYLIFFTGFVCSMILLFKKQTHPILKMLSLLAITNILYIAFFFRTPEFRYVLPSTLAYICFTGIAIAEVRSKFISAEQ